MVNNKFKVEKKCNDGKCIPLKSFCDGKDDCNSDELVSMCGTCPKNQFQCNDGSCIPPISRLLNDLRTVYITNIKFMTGKEKKRTFYQNLIEAFFFGSFVSITPQIYRLISQFK